MKTVALLYGGKSGEHEVSLRSAGSVFTHIDKNSYIILLIGITIQGEWFLQNKAVYKDDEESLSIIKQNPVSIFPGKGFFSRGKNLHVDFVFPVLHGLFGEDGTIQGVLETAGVPYAGSGVLGSAAGMDKCISKHLWQQQKLPVVPFREIKTSRSPHIAEAAETFGFPLFVKPSRAGSSVGIKKVRTMDELEAGISYAFQFDTKLLIEPAVNGREIECSVLGDNPPEAFPPGEILLHEGFYDYTSKYGNTGNARTAVPADLPGNVSSRIREYAVEAFAAVEASGFARVDFFIERETGRILINEINTLPGFTSISMFSQLCEAGGVHYSVMLDRVISLGEKAFLRRKALKRIPEDIF